MSHFIPLQSFNDFGILASHVFDLPRVGSLIQLIIFVIIRCVLAFLVVKPRVLNKMPVFGHDRLSPLVVRHDRFMPVTLNNANQTLPVQRVRFRLAANNFSKRRVQIDKTDGRANHLPTLERPAVDHERDLGDLRPKSKFSTTDLVDQVEPVVRCKYHKPLVVLLLHVLHQLSDQLVDQADAAVVVADVGFVQFGVVEHELRVFL